MKLSRWQSALVEAAIVAFVGCVFAFAANQLSPRGVKLTRDYFPAAPATITTSPQTNDAAVSSSNTTPATSSTNQLAARLAAEGLHLIENAKAVALFGQSKADPTATIFIDARDDNHFSEGHIPGAYQLDRYQPEKYLPGVIPACLAANAIVVYCNGGECEDSEFAARMLKDDIKVPGEKLFVYGGGITEWEAKHLPIETGVRNSGKISPAK